MASAHATLFARKTIAGILDHHARARPHAPAILFGDRHVSYGLLRERSRRLAAFIAARAGPGARVGFFGKESDRYYEVVFACATVGAVLVPINWRLQPGEVEHVISDAGIDLLFIDDDLATGRQPHAFQTEGLTLVGLQEGGAIPSYAEAVGYEPSDELPAVDPDQLFCIMYTSGTTGLPKGVCLSHRAFFEIRESLVRNGLDWLDWRPEERSLVGIPGFHIGGLWWALQNLSAGAAIVVLPWFEPAAAAAAIRTHSVSTACVVPAMLNLLLDHVSDDTTFPKLRKVVYGGSPISKTLLKRSLATFRCEFAQIYGLSETGNTAVCLDPGSHLEGGDRLTAAGRPYPGVDLKVVSAEGQSLPSHEVGEVCIRTPAAMMGYWNLPDATATVMEDGWIHTGDAGYIDDDGYLHICDRLKDVVIIGGEKVYPAEVENAVSAFPTIRECAVVGVPDDLWGERAVCLIVLHPGQDLDEGALMRFLGPRLAPFKIPSTTIAVASLPRNPSGKLLRRALRDAFWEGRARRV